MSNLTKVLIIAAIVIFLLVMCILIAWLVPIFFPQETVQNTNQDPPIIQAPIITEPPPTESIQVDYLPFCQVNLTDCEPPTIRMLDKKWCVKKVPFAIMSAPPGTVYESLDPVMRCQEEIYSDEDIRIVCHSGQQLWSYDMKVCNGSCYTPELLADTGQCPEGYGVNPDKQCCASLLTDSEVGCTTYQVDIGACPGPKESEGPTCEGCGCCHAP